MKNPSIRLSVAFSVVLFIFAGSQHFLLGTQASDLGTFEQFSWLIANGRINEISSLRGISPLEDHFSLLLIPIAFIYKVIPSTYTLIALQSISLGIIPGLASKFAIDRDSPKKLLSAFIFAILLCPYIFLVNLGDFHPEIITAPIMIIAILETTKDRSAIYYLCLLITLCVKKSQVLFGAGLSIYAAVKGQYKKAAITLSLSALWWIISAKFSAAGGDYIKLRLGYLGENKLEILTTLFTKPWTVFTEASPESIFLYTLGLLLPFFALLTRKALPALIGSLPIYLTNIISSSGIQRELNHHYSIGILAFLIVGCIESVDAWQKLSSRAIKMIYYITISLAIISFLGYARIGYFKTRYIPLLGESIAFQKAKSVIPQNSSILTNKTYAAHFANRLMVKTIESNNYMPIDTYDYIILPEKNNFESIGGELELVKESESEPKILKALEEAKRIGMRCFSPNQYIRLCSR